MLTTTGGQTSVNPFSRVWTSRNQLIRPRWSARAGALVDREAGAGDLRAARQVDDVERLGELPVRACASRSRRRRGASAPTSPSSGSLARQQLAPGPDRDVRLLAADRDVRVGRVRDAQEEVLDLGLDVGELGVDGRSMRSPASVDAALQRRRPPGRPASRRP